MLDSNSGIYGDSGDRKYPSVARLVAALLGKQCSPGGSELELSLRGIFADRNERSQRNGCKRERVTSVRIAMAAAIVLMDGVHVESNDLVWVRVDLVRPHNLSTNRREQGNGYPRSSKTADTMKGWFDKFPDPAFGGRKPRKDEHLYLVEVARDSPRSQHDFAATVHGNSPRCDIGRWLWSILYSGWVNENGPNTWPADIIDPKVVISTKERLQQAVDVMKEEAKSVIIAIVEGMDKSAMRPLPESYDELNFGEKAKWLAIEMCRKRPSDFDYDAPPAPMSFQKDRAATDPDRSYAIALITNTN